MADDSQKIVLLVDVTPLMPLAAVEPPVTAFVNLFQLGNLFAVLSYSDEPAPVYPDQGLALYDRREVLDEASAAIARLATGKDDCDMQAALTAGGKLLRRRPEPRAMVMLSASPPTAGNPPLEVLPKGTPIYTIGLGDQGQLEILRQIARASRGAFVFTPTAAGLLDVFLDLIEKLRIAIILAVGARSLGGGQHYSLVGRFAADTPVGTFLAYWGDPAVTFGPGEPGKKQVSVAITGPAGKLFPVPPAYAGSGFVVFLVPLPEAGSWTVDATYHGAGTCGTTLATLANTAITAAAPAPEDS